MEFIGNSSLFIANYIWFNIVLADPPRISEEIKLKNACKPHSSSAHGLTLPTPFKIMIIQVWLTKRVGASPKFGENDNHQNYLKHLNVLWNTCKDL